MWRRYVLLDVAHDFHVLSKSDPYFIAFKNQYDALLEFRWEYEIKFEFEYYEDGSADSDGECEDITSFHIQ